MFVLIIFCLFSFMIGTLIGVFGTFRYIRHKETKSIINSLYESDKNFKE